MQRILGIDQSLTSTGFCAVESFSVLAHGVITTSASEEHLSVFTRSIYISDEILALVKKHEITEVRLEGLAFGSRGNAERNLGILQGVIITKLMENGIERDNIKIITPTSLKKFATGSGKSDKVQMFESLPDWIKPDIEMYKKTKGRSDVTDAFYLSMFDNEDYRALGAI